MGRGLIVVLIAGFMTFTIGLLGLVSTDAQEGTPQVGMIGVEIASGVTFELVPSSEDPPSLYRLRLAPGASLSFVDDPAISLVYVESGELTLQMDAEVSDARPDVPREDEQDADPALTVNLGDYFVLPPQVAGEMRNESPRSVSIVIAAITPGMIPGSAIATPVPE